MNKEDAKALCSLPLGTGKLNGDEPWVIAKHLVTDKVTKVWTRFTDASCTGVFYVTDKKDTSSSKLFEDTTVAPSTEANDKQEELFVTRDQKGNALCAAKKITSANGFESFYIYTTKPAFKWQEPGLVEKFTADNDEGSPSVETELYVFARVVAISNGDSNTKSAMFSYCKGIDSDNESGYAWKDLYKGIKKPQFMYAATVVDMEGNVICKSKQESALDIRPVYEVAPGADLLAITSVCYPILPNGAQIGSGIEAAIELATLFI